MCLLCLVSLYVVLDLERLWEESALHLSFIRLPWLLPAGGLQNMDVFAAAEALAADRAMAADLLQVEAVSPVAFIAEAAELLKGATQQAQQLQEAITQAQVDGACRIRNEANSWGLHCMGLNGCSSGVLLYPVYSLHAVCIQFSPRHLCLLFTGSETGCTASAEGAARVQ